MSAHSVLEKLTAHNEPVIGCAVIYRGECAHNLTGRYEMIDVQSICDNAETLFDAVDNLDSPDDRFDQVYLEMENHCVYARRINDAVLVTLLQPTPRDVFKKVQVGVNLFAKPLARAINETGLARPAGVEQPRAQVQSEQPQAPQSPSDPADGLQRGERMRRKRVYRGIEY